MSTSKLEVIDDGGVPKAKLVSGGIVPLVGFGTSDVIGTGLPGDPAYEAIKSAIKSGYRFIDSAALYGNEEVVGKAIKDAINEGLVTREDLVVCTKVWCTAHKRESVLRSCKESLRKLQLDYVDMYLIHWPVAYVEDGDPVNPRDPVTGKLLYSDTHYTETWQGMQDCVSAGLARVIGLSNFNHKMIEDIWNSQPSIYPEVNQVECHPYLTQEKLLAFCKGKNILLNAYCPLGSPGAKQIEPVLMKDAKINELAAKYNRSPAQICLRFQVQRGISVIPKSLTPKRIEENINICDFKISDEDMEQLLKLNRNLRYCTDTAGEHVDDHPFYPFHEEY